MSARTMSCPFLSLLPESKKTSLIPWLATELAGLMPSVLVEPNHNNNGCLLAEMGDFFVQAVKVLSRLATVMVHGRNVEVYIQERF